MRRPLARTVVFATLAALATFQLVGVTMALVAATRPRVTDFGLLGPGLGGHADLVRVRAHGGLPVDSVFGPALEAGLRPGDVITRVGGVRTTDRPGVWYAGRFTTPPETPLRLTVRRDGRDVETTLVTRRLSAPLRWSFGPGVSLDYRLLHWWNWGPPLLMAFFMYAVGMTLGLLRRNDSTAWLFALVLLGICLATSLSFSTPLLHVWPPGLVLFWVLINVR